jgi:hypothetical protein
MDTLPSPAFNFWQKKRRHDLANYIQAQQDNEYKAKAPRGALRSADEPVRRS